MPIDDERRRLRRTKATTHAKPQAKVTAEGELGSRDRMQESIKRLHDMLLLQRDEQSYLLAEEEKRIEANKQAAERVRNERNDKYERLRQAFERMKKKEGRGGG